MNALVMNEFFSRTLTEAVAFEGNSVADWRLVLESRLKKVVEGPTKADRETAIIQLSSALAAYFGELKELP